MPRSLTLMFVAGLLLGASTLARPGRNHPADAGRRGQGRACAARASTVFDGATRSEFDVEILGVLENVVGPRRSLILARLSGNRLAETGVMQGMSGSPVYVDGRLIGAVSYSLGAFSKEPIAGITPIAEMIDATDPSAAARPRPRGRRRSRCGGRRRSDDFVAALRETFSAPPPRRHRSGAQLAGVRRCRRSPGVPAGAMLAADRHAVHDVGLLGRNAGVLGSCSPASGFARPARLAGDGRRRRRPSAGAARAGRCRRRQPHQRRSRVRRHRHGHARRRLARLRLRSSRSSISGRPSSR